MADLLTAMHAMVWTDKHQVVGQVSESFLPLLLSSSGMCRMLRGKWDSAKSSVSCTVSNTFSAQACNVPMSWLPESRDPASGFCTNNGGGHVLQEESQGKNILPDVLFTLRKAQSTRRVRQEEVGNPLVWSVPSMYLNENA